MLRIADVGPRDAERDRAMARYGRQVAPGPATEPAGRRGGGTGWRRALQVATDQSRQDREILRLADELYSAAPDLTASAGVRAYAVSTLSTVTGSAATWFLRGMLERPDLEAGDDHNHAA